VEFSEDSLTWSTLGEFEFEQGTGNTDYAGFTGPDFQGQKVRYVLFSALSNWGDADCAGLTEVQFNLSEDQLPTPVQSDLLKGTVIMYPNPAREQVTLSYSSTAPATWNLSLYNLLGQEVTSVQYTLETGNNRLVFSLARVPGGTYWLRATNAVGEPLYGQLVVVAP